MNKVFGIILYIVGTLFILAFVGQLSKFLAVIISLFKLFSSELDGFQRGNIIGSLIYWIFHFAIIYFSFKYGRKLYTKKQIKDQP